MIDRTDIHWYRDALIYQVHVKSFFDADNDGVGDFVGLTEKLDYIRDLGVTAIWVMPFYPSPLRDDGYDIQDYLGINPSYGTMDDFKAFIDAAHERGIRVITELVINHTSDQHPWFQAARNAPKGSPERDFYVWSDTDQKYTDTRIIFLDTEPSNWTWDPVAGQYFWHRFYSHQPDLNFDNPAVLESVIETMYYWLDMGVDGLRLDAIPYLIEREGTNCENLDETHTVIKAIRAALDARYPDRMLLAEANQWPEETAPYFGDGDECHLSFHFPLMPRMYMALAQEDRHPITDIMRQTPEIPEGCQWAIFLRNHDELTLEMVTDKERDYLWTFYAADRRARINLGIRRRLAPLLENDRRKIELLNSLLFSMPGTPVMYYGDEIGMGDNIYLGDRDGVRTPMQWSPDRNGGFSRADPARLFLPTIQDSIYGYDAVNVESQSRIPASLYNWMRRLIGVRRSSQAFGRGTLRFLYPSNRKVLVYLREYEGETIVCVANVSRAPQAVEVDLSEFSGATPVEMTGSTAFPRIGDLPYLLTLPAYGFYWFQLVPTEAGAEDRFGPPAQPELFTLVLTKGLRSLLEGREREALERTILPNYVTTRRWFAAKGDRIRSVRLVDYAVMPNATGQESFLLPSFRVELKSGAMQTYSMPLAFEEGESEALLPYAVARVRHGRRTGFAFGAASSSEFTQVALDAIRDQREMETVGGGRIVFRTTSDFEPDLSVDPGEIRRLSGEQSNTSILIGEDMVLKIYRRLQSGPHPEVEVGRFLTEVAGFRNSPSTLGTIEYVSPEGATVALALLQSFVRNQGDAWRLTVETLSRELDMLALMPPEDDEALLEATKPYLRYAAVMGRRTGEMHAAFATPTDDENFASEPLTAEDVAAAVADAREQADRAFAALAAIRDQAGSVADLLGRRDECLALLDGLAIDPRSAIKSRIHGDFHLGQVLIAQDDVMIVDFEGEPSRPSKERRGKFSPLRDVAGMLRSFAYAADAGARDVASRLPETSERIALLAGTWLELVEAQFLHAYEEATEGSPAWVEDDATRRALMRLHLLGKAFYEINYEANNRPDWIEIPVRGVLALLDEGANA
ncbi:maltose alpha-D-glucosyltransferase [Enterovirga rhinocerotis]|uniref:Maltokinase n=1 Tax=Enterovirga rhinocerotis TaxID=1339210 RepID=A0A4V3DXR5_9HYPH|nr:maltose alpha-D-glucosyltransferase [Enterovirga rhinocerotis]TDR89749.1 trehalose synthase /maltokinase [Enterovirga rhinocerotis]